MKKEIQMVNKINMSEEIVPPKGNNLPLESINPTVWLMY